MASLNDSMHPDETTILNFRRLLEKHELADGILQVINGYPREPNILYAGWRATMTVAPWLVAGKTQAIVPVH